MVDLDGNPIPVGFEALLKPAEVAQLMRVDPRTVANWAKEGKLRCSRTAGGHRRFPEDAVRAALAGDWERAAHGKPTTDLIFVPE
jgi:excisionase family DNA binding protein